MSETGQDDAADLLRRIGSLGAALVEDSCSDVAQLRSLVQDASKTLAQSFESLQQGVARQRDAIHDLVERGAEGEGGLSRFVGEAGAVLEDLVSQLLRVTERGREVEQSVAAIVAQLERANAVTSRTKKIADQTRLLAINAKIQAVHAGEFGASFMVVANEVSGLAHEVRVLNEEVSGLVGETIVGAQAAASEIASGAAQDGAAAHAARGRVEDLLRGVAGLDSSIASSVEAIAKQSSDIAESVGAAVRCLQFEDIATQVATHSLSALTAFAEALRALEESASAESREHALERAHAALDALAARADARRHKPAQQADLSAGEVELF